MAPQACVSYNARRQALCGGLWFGSAFWDWGVGRLRHVCALSMALLGVVLTLAVGDV
jgi:hypothetical protein